MFSLITIFTDLRKQARHLENDIDLKLVAFSKLSAGINTPHHHNSTTSDTVPLLAEEDTFEAMALEIEQLLNKVVYKKKTHTHTIELQLFVDLFTVDANK